MASNIRIGVSLPTTQEPDITQNGETSDPLSSPQESAGVAGTPDTIKTLGTGSFLFGQIDDSYSALSADAPPEKASLDSYQIRDHSHNDLIIARSPDLLHRPLYVQGPGDANEVDMNDINQGPVGDCFFLASLAALAEKDPEAIKNMIRDNGDGSYTVTFHEKQARSFPNGGEYYVFVDKQITISDAPQTIDGGADMGFHARKGDTDVYGRREIWPLIVERAYTQWKGDLYLGSNGGHPTDAMEALTGRQAISKWPAQETFDQFKSDFDSGKPQVVSTPKEWGNFLAITTAAGYQLVPSHAYTVQNVYLDENGEQWVQLYNPWGRQQPPPIRFEELPSLSDGISTGQV